LARPIKRARVSGEWAQIMDHPSVGGRGTAGTDQIAEQVKVERSEDQEQSCPTPHAESTRDPSNSTAPNRP
jgi:anti-sigma regulatory factor (Ser/Thr protein kinase)